MRGWRVWLPVLIIAAYVIAVVAGGAARAEDRVKAKCQWTIEAEYPKFGNEKVDEAIQKWLEESIAGTMRSAADLVDLLEPEYSVGMEVEYDTVRFSPEVVSVAFTTHIFPYRAAHPSADIAVLNLSPVSGALLSLDDLFKDPDMALGIFSECARSAVAEELAEEFKEEPDMNVEELTTDDWFKNGSAPTRENYSTFAVEADGIKVYFQQYQILAYAFGMRVAHIPLEKLAPAGPNEKIWPKR